MKAEEIALLLPWVYQRTNHPGNPLSVLLDVMEGLQEHSEGILAGVDAYFDPYRAPDRFVPYLASWMDLDRLLESGADGEGPGFAPGIGRLRDLIASNAYLSSWRGTSTGLLRFLEVATGTQGFVIDENPIGPDNLPRPFHVRIEVPPAARDYEALIVRIVEAEKPAYVTCEVVMTALHEPVDRLPEEHPETEPDA